MMLFDEYLQVLEQGPGRASRSTMGGFASVGTDVGLIRSENQDRAATVQWLAHHNGQQRLALVVCDGMGGMEAGSECAALACAAFLASLTLAQDFDLLASMHNAVLAANEKVYGAFASRGGATLSAIVILPDGKVCAANVGDSRIYAFDRDVEGANVHRLTTDDTLSEVLGRPSEKGLIQYVGMGSGLKPHVRAVPRVFTDILITTDGAHYVASEVFAELAIRSPDAKARTERLVAFARWMGGHDNITVASANVEGIANALRSVTGKAITLTTPALEKSFVILSRPEERPVSGGRNSDRDLPSNGKSSQPKRKSRKTKSARRADHPEQLKIDIELSPDRDDEQ